MRWSKSTLQSAKMRNNHSKETIINIVAKFLRVLFPHKPLPVAPTSILVLKPCCLGDVLLATPAIAALKWRFPNAEIDVAVGRWSRAVLVNNPHIRSLIDCETVGQGRYTLGDVWRLARKLRAQNYDMAVTLDRSPLVGAIPWLASIPHRLGLDSFGRGFAHTVRVPVPRQPAHEAQIYLDCALFGIENSPNFWTNFQPHSTEKFADMSEKFAILHPAGGVNPGMQMTDKRWPPARFAALADRFAQAGFVVMFSGTQSDVPLCETIVSQMSNQALARIMAGKSSLGEFGTLCQRAAIFVGGDTGAMHIAVASGCKTVAIFGPSDPRRYAPFAPKTQCAVVWRARELPVGGVGQGMVDDFSWDDGASVDEVWSACQKLLKSNEE